MTPGGLRRWWRSVMRSALGTDTQGVTMVEYGLLVAAVALTAMASMSMVSNAIQNALSIAQQNIAKN